MEIRSFFYEILAAFSFVRFRDMLLSPLYFFCLLGGFIALLLPPAGWPSGEELWMRFLIAPFIEELTWRVIAQNEIEKIFPSKQILSPANLIVSTVFAVSHYMINGGLLAILTFFPSLLFGIVWTRSHSLWSCMLLHSWYNIAQCLL